MTPNKLPPPPPATNSISAEQLVAAFMLDAPVPIRLLYGLYGKRSTFHVWKGLGLDIRPIPGMGPTIIPSEFKAFLLKLRRDFVPNADRVEMLRRLADQRANSAAGKAG